MLRDGETIILGPGNEEYKLAGETVVEEHGISADFTYEERLVLLTYIQFHFKMITQEQYNSEITRLGFTMEQLNTLFSTKGELLHKYDVMFKESMWDVFHTYLPRIEGFSEAMEQEIHQFIMSSSDVVNLA